jgi:hypothetical protein
MSRVQIPSPTPKLSNLTFRLSSAAENHLNVVFSELAVPREQNHTFHLSLRDQQAIEGISVVDRQSAGLQGMLVRNVERTKAQGS